MMKRLFGILALATAGAIGFSALVIDPPTDNKAPPQDPKVGVGEPKGG